MVIHAAKVRADEENERVIIAKGQAIEAERIRSANAIRTLEIEQEKESELSDIASKTALETQRILTRQQVEAERIENERKVREQEIRARQTVSIFENNAAAAIDQTRLENERQVEASRIETSRTIELLSVERDKDIHISNRVAAAAQERASLVKRHAIEIDRLAKEEEIAERDIARDEKLKLAQTEALRRIEDARIAVEREVDEMRVAARRYVERFEIEQQREVELVDKERLIAIINKAIEEANAQTQAANARKLLVAVEEQIESVRAEEIADRTHRVGIIDARTRAEREALRLVSEARAQMEASEHRAAATVAEAQAMEVRLAKEAEGARMLNESENMRNEGNRRSAIYEHLVKTLPSIIRETVKPMERIESIKILQVDGVPGLNSPSERAGAGGEGSAGGGMTDRVVNSAMKYRTQVAFVDGLMKDLGLPLDHLGNAGGLSFRNFAPAPDRGKDED